VRPSLPRLCAITDRRLAGGMTHDRITDAMLRGGARWIQLREKDLRPGPFLLQAASAASLARACGAILVVNDRVDLALAAGGDGVHLGRDDLPAEEARILLGPDRLVGVSTHSVEEGIAAARLPVDYVAIGPVFATTTKKDAEPVVGPAAVGRLAETIDLPVVGIGGIGPGNARSVLDAGASAVAVISGLYGAGTIEEGVARMLEIVLR
jgi:thiamine-phosphate diphosphorylase